ncbi:MAG: acetyltransferase [Anaerolineaceae bacterium]|nr:MAG: acetyltransferase [Anaerolineaceae bacterium]
MGQIRKILLLGAGGHCLSVLDSLKSLDLYECIGLVVKDKGGSSSLDIDKNMREGIFVVGSDKNLPLLKEEGYTDAFITVGSIGNPIIRQRLYHRLKQIGYNIPNIIDKSAVVGTEVSLGEGIYVGKNAVINIGCKIGNCAIINTMALIEHECSVGDFAHIAPGSILCGNVAVGENTHIGAGSMIRQGLNIGTDSIIGMGSVVLSHISNHVTAYGNPCKEVIG